MLLQDFLAAGLTHGPTLVPRKDEKGTDASTQEAEMCARQLANDILRAVPYLIGHAYNEQPARPSCESGIMLARSLTLFPLSVVEQSPSATPTQKTTAANLRRWL